MAMRDYLGATVDRLAGRIGGARMLALPLLRLLAMVALVVWLALAPAEYRASGALFATVGAFLVYSLGIEAALWWRPAAILRLSFYVLLVDQAFALALIHLTGGARNAFYLALPLIAGLQAYYYGLRRGVAVALISATAYVALVWHTIEPVDVANVSIQRRRLAGRGNQRRAGGRRRRARADTRDEAHGGRGRARPVHKERDRESARGGHRTRS